MAGQSAKMGPVLRGEISNTQSRPLNGHPPSILLKSIMQANSRRPTELSVNKDFVICAGDIS